MAYINLTPHEVSVYCSSAFEGLEQKSDTTYLADSVYSEQAIAVFPSKGEARISTTSIDSGLIDKIPTVKTSYGEAQGIPEKIEEGDLLIVSLPMQSMAKASKHPLADRMMVPSHVVRDRANPSKVLGCMKLAF